MADLRGAATGDDSLSEQHVAQMSDGARILLRRTGRPDGQRLVASHGVGFAIDGFSLMWRHLKDDFDLVLFDLRGHGRNPKVDPASVEGPRIVEDTKEIVGQIDTVWGTKPLWGLFHSYSGLAALRLENVEPGCFAGLVLIEPPATRPPGHPLFAAFEAGRLALAERSAKRQAVFDSVGELAAKYAGRAQYAHFAEGAADALAGSLLVPDGTRWRLACPPAVESRFYATNIDDGLWDRLGNIACPVTMLAGGNDLANEIPPAVTARDLAHAGGFDFVEVAGTTHMMILERPRFVAEIARAVVRASSGLR